MERVSESSPYDAYAPHHASATPYDRSLEAEGRTDQSKADLKQAGEKVKDAFKG